MKGDRPLVPLLQFAPSASLPLPASPASLKPYKRIREGNQRGEILPGAGTMLGLPMNLQIIFETYFKRVQGRGRKSGQAPSPPDPQSEALLVQRTPS